MKTNEEILGGACVSNSKALMALRDSAFSMIKHFDTHDKNWLIAPYYFSIIAAAEDELLCWPKDSPQEACMI